MVTEVYADLYFLVNVSMDLLCLMITANLLHWRVRRWRVLAAALLGGGYALAALLLSLSGLRGILCDLAAVFAICLVAFAQKGIKPWGILRATAVDALISALLGGIMTALFSLLNRLELPLELLQGDDLSVWMFALLAALAGFFTLRGGRFFGHGKNVRSMQIKLTLLGQTVTLSGMVDSGNLLRDPVSGRQVIAVERERLRGILPDAFFADGSRWIPDMESARRLRLIPAQAATGNGLLTAFLPDALVIIGRSGEQPSDCLIAPVSLGGRADGFDALLPSD